MLEVHKVSMINLETKELTEIGSQVIDTDFCLIEEEIADYEKVKVDLTLPKEATIEISINKKAFIRQCGYRAKSKRQVNKIYKKEMKNLICRLFNYEK